MTVEPGDFPSQQVIRSVAKVLSPSDGFAESSPHLSLAERTEPVDLPLNIPRQPPDALQPPSHVIHHEGRLPDQASVSHMPVQQYLGVPGRLATVRSTALGENPLEYRSRAELSDLIGGVR